MLKDLFHGPLVWCLVAVLATLQAGAAMKHGALSADQLRCEYRENPLGINETHPRLSWLCEASDSRSHGARQTAYQVLVGSSPERLEALHGDLWDTGKVASDQSVQVEYAGKPLVSRQPCFWKVRVWDEHDNPSAWSQPAAWSMGLLQPGDWQAHWIGYDKAYSPSPETARDDALLNTQGLKWVRFPEKQAHAGLFAAYMRKRVELSADRKIRRAVAVLYAFNHCRVAVNGTPVGEAAHWDRTARLDLTPGLHFGENVVTLAVTHSDSHQPAVVGRLVFQFDSGPDLILPVDASWRVSQDPASEWDQALFDDRGWAAAEPMDGMPWKGPASVSDLPRIPAPYLRKEFTVVQPVKRATAYVTALGVYELHLNGKQVGHDVLTPGWTEFRRRVQYQTYDVTNQIHPGQNAVGAILGDGWYAGVLAHLARRQFYGGRPRLLMQLVLELADGTTQTVATDSTWKADYGPILHADLLLGCEYDARKAMPGWDTAGYVEPDWKAVVDDGGAARKTSDGHNLMLQAANVEPSRRLEELPARAVTEPKPGCYIFDLGQNMVGWARLKLRGAAGQRVTVRHGEMLNPDGTLYTANLRSCPAADFYLLSGQGEEVLEPYFTFHGFRYVELRGLPSRPGKGAVTGVVVHTDMRRTGTFECSSPLLNQLYRNIVWGHKGNYLEVPTDCPQRDERMGWTGDTQFFAPTAAYNYDVAPFFTRWLNTICQDSQYADGSFPHVVPDIMGGGGATAWGDAALLCTYNIYHAYGDKRVVSAHFAAMDRYMQWLAARSKDGITRVGGFGDWLNLGGGAAGPAIDTAYRAHLARLMAEMARAIGRTADAERYDKLFQEVKAAFVRTYVQPDGSLKECSQTGYALAFTMDLLPAELREKAAGKYVDEVKRFDWHLATGFIGTPRLLPGLNAAGRDDVAYKLLLQESYPSWLFQVKQGATTMWERWDGWTPERGFQTIEMNSFNHYAFGAVAEYLYSGVGGIAADSPGYKTIRIRPIIRDGLTWAKTGFDSMYGRIATSWKKEQGRLSLEVTVPANTSATVYVPALDEASVRESGKPISRALGVRFLRMEKGDAVFAVEPGTYRFEIRERDPGA